MSFRLLILIRHFSRYLAKRLSGRYLPSTGTLAMFTLSDLGKNGKLRHQSCDATARKAGRDQRAKGAKGAKDHYTTREFAFSHRISDTKQVRRTSPYHLIDEHDNGAREN